MAQTIAGTNLTSTDRTPSGFAQIGEPWMDLPVKTNSDVIPENENQDWKKPVITPLSPEAQSWIYVERVEHELTKIRQEAEEAYASDKEIDPVPESAYEEALLLAKILFDSAIPVPHISWAEDGSLGFEWRPEDGIVTIGIYGDGLVIYCAFFSEQRQIEGVCALSDTVILSGFLKALSNFHF